MTKIYIIEIDDRDYDAGSTYTIGAFTSQAQAEQLKQKIEQVFSYVEQRALRFNERLPNTFVIGVAERLFNTLKKNPKYKFLEKVEPSYWCLQGPLVNIREDYIYTDLAEYPKGYA